MAKSSDYGLGEYVFPRGWFMVSPSDAVTNKPTSHRFFGRDVVLYRGESGKAYMVGAYCPHMQTNIGRSTGSYTSKMNNQVDGESIRCPYHGWRFGADGKCNQVPGSDFIPTAARIDAYNVIERYGAVFYWHDPEGGEPDYDLPILPQWEDPRWIAGSYDLMGTIELHPIEIVDNICDVRHLYYVHAMTPVACENEIRGTRVWQRLRGRHEWLGGDASVSEFNTFYVGPGILISRFDGDTPAIMMILHTPVDDGVVKAWHNLLLAAPSENISDFDRANAQAYQLDSFNAFNADFEIWTHKGPCYQPMQMRHDGQFGRVRTWYKQFYNRRSKSNEFVERSEGCYSIWGMEGVPATSESQLKLAMP